MSWHEGPLFAWDTETTGVDTETARVVTATTVWISGKQVETHDWLINPNVDIPTAASDVHGVTNEIARTRGVAPAGALAALWDDIQQAWATGRPVIGFNLAYDFTVLDRELRRHGIGQVTIDGPVVDGFVIDKELDKYRRGKRTLEATCQHYGVRLDGAHDATEDALAAARLAYKLAQQYPDQLADLTKVNDLQAGWRAAWAAGFRDYLRRQGKPADDVDDHWPLRPMAAAS